MLFSEQIFHPLPQIQREKLPQNFTYPFNYRPHPWVELAAQQLMDYLHAQKDFSYAFGHDAQSVGKMFGILIVQNSHRELGYLAAFSGKINEENQLPGFVPPVFDVLQPSGAFKTGETELNQINDQVRAIENSESYQALREQWQTTLASQKQALKNLKIKHQKSKKLRAAQRKELSLLDFSTQSSKLAGLEHESKQDHFEEKDQKRYWKAKLSDIQLQLQKIEDQIATLKTERKEKSSQLQRVLHESFQFQNAQFQQRNLLEIFEDFQMLPPAGAGECAAPRLLQYAYKNGYQPIAMGEFWYGKSSLSQLREHGKFYPACKSKCFPILSFMLQGLQVEKNPAEQILQDYSIDVLYEDEYFMAVNKPHQVLSVPGKEIKDSLQSRMQSQWNNPEMLLAHRLDMATSGIILAAKNIEVYKKLQQLFTERKVKKTYTAILDGEIAQKSGQISLPLRVDLDHRPMQLVDEVHGKAAITYFRQIEREDGKTKVLFYPLTGRTHQLRIHAAHPLGLHASIVGDDLYGSTADRLYLHATVLEFVHPFTDKKMKLIAAAPF